MILSEVENAVENEVKKDIFFHYIQHIYFMLCYFVLSDFVLSHFILIHFILLSLFLSFHSIFIYISFSQQNYSPLGPSCLVGPPMGAGTAGTTGGKY